VDALTSICLNIILLVLIPKLLAASIYCIPQTFRVDALVILAILGQENKPMIKADYPNVYKLIIRSLSFLDNRDDFEEQFPMLDLNLVNTIRSHLLKYKIEVSRQESRQIYYNAFKEVGVNLLTY